MPDRGKNKEKEPELLKYLQKTAVFLEEVLEKLESTKFDQEKDILFDGIREYNNSINEYGKTRFLKEHKKVSGREKVDWRMFANSNKTSPASVLVKAGGALRQNARKYDRQNNAIESKDKAKFILKIGDEIKNRGFEMHDKLTAIKGNERS